MFRAVRLNALTYPADPIERTELARAGAKFVEVEGQRPEEIVAAAADCDALLVVSSYVPATVIEKLTRCRVIARMGTGTDRVDVEAATAAGIVVTNVPDFCIDEQAEHVLALMFAWVRRLPTMFQAMRQGDWSARSHQGVHRLAGQALGLVGFGASAQQVARRALGLGLRLQAWARDPARYQAVADALNVTLVGLDQVLAENDFVSLHVPLAADTRHLLSADRLAQMRQTAVLINTARGAVVDEQALVAALKMGRLAGACLDVYEGIDVFAPPGAGPPTHPLLDLDNVLLTPHCAGSSVESTMDSHVRGSRNAADVLLGNWPRHVVNPSTRPRFPLRHA